MRMFKRIARHRSTITIGILRTVLYVGMFCIFFGMMSINNWQLRNPSRTLATTLLTWAAITAAMHSVYGGFAVGHKKSKPIISGLSLSVIMTDLVTYVQLQIMNVNIHNKSQLDLFGRDLPWLIIGMVLQLAFIILLVRIGNQTYFNMNPPRKGLLILADKYQKAAMMRKIERYALQWQVTETVLYSDPNIRTKIDASQVVFLSTGIPGDRRMELLQTCYDLHRDVLCKAQLQDIMLSSSRQVVLDDAPFLEMDYGKMTLGQRIVKRVTDIFVSAVVLVVLSPLMLLISLCIFLEDGAPVIYRQERMTVAGHKFRICKFRTMRHHENVKQVSAMVDDDRITKVGRILRRTRVDELPQLWNILCGDMTLVGPRPEMMENVEKYKMQLPTFVYREKMKAGLTGYAQIEGKYNTTPEDKLMLDLMYIENYSTWEDIKLLFRTITVFFKSDSTAGFENKEMNQPENKEENI